jgi:alpha-mannosidase
MLSVAWPAFAAEPKPPAAAPPVEQVIVVFKTHFDIGYTQLAREVVERYRTSMIEKALAVCDASQTLPPENRFVWTLSGWPMTQILWPGQTPERRTRIEKAIREGRLVWHALAGTTHTESLGLEDLVRSLGFSSRLARQFGQPLPRDAKMTDVPCHTWVVPTVLRRAGIDFLHLGCNSASGSPEVPALFWWEGPDGSRLLTMYTAEGYGTGLKPPAGWQHKTWLALIHTGDNHGPPEPGEVQKLLERAKRELPGVKIRMGRLSDFGDAILAEEKQSPKLPVIRKDMPDSWIHGIMSMPIETSLARQVRPDIASLESLNTLLDCWGVKAPPVKDRLAAAYEESFLYSEHTWGVSSRFYSPRLYREKWMEAEAAGKYKYAEESWKEHGDYIRNAGDAEPALGENAFALAKAVNVPGPRIVVYNPLPWARTITSYIQRADAVEGPPWYGPLRVPKKYMVGWRDAATGKTLPMGLWSGDVLPMTASDVPAMGYRIYVPVGPQKPNAVPKSKAPKVGANTKPVPAIVDSPFFRVEFDTLRGGIKSIVDKRTGRELVDRKSEYALGQYLYERFDKNYHIKFLEDYCKKPLPGWADEFGRANLPPASEVAYSATSPRDFELSQPTADNAGHSPPLQTTIKLTPKGEPAGRFELSVTLFRDHPYVDIGFFIGNKQPDPWPEAGWLCLPFAIDQPQFRLGRLGSIIDPAKDCVRGANNEMYCVDTGLTITGGDGKGVGICPIVSPLVSLGRPGAFRYTKEWTPRKPTVFVNLFNNIWGTNFQQWIGGFDRSCEVRIWSAEGKGAEADLITPAWEARTDCQAAFFDGPPGKLPPMQSGLELSRKGVLVTAFGPNPDGDGILLRLWEQAGQDGVCRVRLPEALRTARPKLCDLRGRPLEQPITMRDGWLEVPLTHFAPASVILAR